MNRRLFFPFLCRRDAGPGPSSHTVHLPMNRRLFFPFLCRRDAGPGPSSHTVHPYAPRASFPSNTPRAGSTAVPGGPWAFSIRAGTTVCSPIVCARRMAHRRTALYPPAMLPNRMYCYDRPLPIWRTAMTATTATMDITNPVLRGMYPDPSWMWDEPGERVALVNSFAQGAWRTAEPPYTLRPCCRTECTVMTDHYRYGGPR